MSESRVAQVYTAVSYKQQQRRRRRRQQQNRVTYTHYKRQWYTFLFTDNHDVLFDKRMIWFFGLYCKPIHKSIS